MILVRAVLNYHTVRCDTSAELITSYQYYARLMYTDYEGEVSITSVSFADSFTCNTGNRKILLIFREGLASGRDGGTRFERRTSMKDMTLHQRHNLGWVPKGAQNAHRSIRAA